MVKGIPAGHYTVRMNRLLFAIH
ncbi:hypothetical protein [Edaphobacter modestus]